MKKTIIPVLLASAVMSAAGATFSPVTLTDNSYTFDIVVESNTAAALPYCINVTAGNGSGLGDNTYYEQGLYARAGQSGGNTGIPIHNTVFTNINNANMTFLMPPDYTTNNTLMIDSTYGSGTFYFQTPTAATSLAILNAGGGGTVTIPYTVTHADLSTESGTLSLLDWFNGGPTVAWGANGRISSGGSYDHYNSSSVNNKAPYLYANKITVSGSSPIVSIAFTFSSGNHGNLFAVSGNNGGSSWTPIPVSGFNVQGIVPAAFPLTATMDQGTNTVNNGNLATWFEKGFIRGTPAAGLPPSGSSFTSLAQPAHTYKLGNYSTNNAILIDTNHLTANIKLPSPAAYTAFAFLTAGGNVGASTPMQDICILQHADGVSETNLFYGYDWFSANAAGSLAYKANGRVNMYSRTVNNVNNGYPYLFETYFTLTDITSPVTNIVVQYKSAHSASSTTYIMAISASTDAIAPVITGNPLPANQGWYLGQTASMTVQVAGSQPLTNLWLVERNGAYVPLTDGVDVNGSTVSGSSTTTLAISGLTSLDATNYEYYAANAVGSVTSSPVSVSIKGRAGVVATTVWNNIANNTFTPGNNTNIICSDKVSTARLTLSNPGITNSYSSGLTGDGANDSLMNGYMDCGQLDGYLGTITFDNLTDSAYDVYLYTFGDTTKPGAATNGLPNYSVNATTYYAPALGYSGASTYDATSASVGGTGFNGFIQSTTSLTNDFNQDLPVSSFGNYIKIAGVSTGANGEIQIEAEADTASFRSPLNGIELVGTTSGKIYAVHFLGNTSDSILPGTATAPIIDSQSPSNSVISVLANHAVTTTLSVTVDSLSPTPYYYQWYNGATAVANATNSSYVNVDTNAGPVYCLVSNFVGATSSSPVTFSFFQRPALSSYQSAIFAYNPVAYWPLNETSGTAAFDWAGTNDGTYNGNFTLGANGLPATTGLPTNTAAGFDGTNAYVDVPVGNLNITGAVTLVQWIQPPSGADTGFTTTLGHSNGGYRLDVASGQAHFADGGSDVVGTVAVNDGNWHLLVGVYDGTNQYLYVDGQSVGTPQAATGGGTTSYGVRIAGAPDYTTRYFQGSIAQAAILPQALNATQVLALFNGMGTPPGVTVTPANPSVYAGTSVTFTAVVTGATATSFQWYVIDTSGNSNNIAGATSTTYTLSNIPVSDNGYTYGINVINSYGSATATASLSVQTGPAYLSGDISPLTGEAYVGAPVTYTVSAAGTTPIFYQWLVNGVAVTGATNASFTLAAACGSQTIQATFTNADSAGSAITSSQATLSGDAYPTNLTFNTDGTAWQLNGVATLANNVLGLTDGGGSEAASAFYTVPQYVGRFTTSFDYVGNGGADGTTFTIQNYLTGASALGGGGGSLGYNGISNSIALEINLYTGAGVSGISAGTNGGIAAYQSTGDVSVNSGDPIRFTLNFADGVLFVHLLDTTTLATFSTSYTYGSLTPILGGTDLGYVGFSGGDGGLTSIQTISNFSFSSVITPVIMAASSPTNGSFIISWPAADPNYVLQSSPSLSAPVWTGSFIPVTVNGVNRVTITAAPGAAATFYRLTRVVCQ